MEELTFLNKKVSLCQVCTALWKLKQIGMGHLTKSLLPACLLAQLFISLGIGWSLRFLNKIVSWPCVPALWNLLKQIGMGRLTKSLPPARPLANRCHLFHSASLHKVQFGCRRQLFFLVAPIYLPTFIMKLYTRPCPWHSFKYQSQLSTLAPNTLWFTY